MAGHARKSCDEGIPGSRRKVRPRPLRLGEPIRVFWMDPRVNGGGLRRAKTDDPALYEFLTSPGEMAGLVKVWGF